MSLSRQVLSSPFDAPQRPRTVASRQSGDRKKVKEGGSGLLHAGNIMSDTRVVRRSTFTAATSKNNINNDTTDSGSNEEQQPGCVIFDSRLIKGDVFANPIVTIKNQHHQGNNDDAKKIHQTRQRAISTPPPVKGRRHISIQTDDNAGGDTPVDDTRDETSRQTSACANSLEDLTIDVVDKEADKAEITDDVVDVPHASDTNVEILLQKENVAPLEDV